MRTLPFLLIASALVLVPIGCSHPPQGPGPRSTPLPGATTGGAPSAPASLPGVIGQSMCNFDADCPGEKICRPRDGACVDRYPRRGNLVASRAAGASVQGCDLSPVYFAVDSAELTPEAQSWLDYDMRCLEALHMGGMVVTGHADVRGDPAYNEQLSAKRAQAVRDYMQQHGYPGTLAVRALGSQEMGNTPPERTEQDFAWHRRVDLLVK